GFLFLFFWGALAFVESPYLCVAFSVLTGLMRPEGPVIYAFLFFIFTTIHGVKGRWKWLIGLVLTLIPFPVYHYITGSFLPQGVLSQNILHYQDVFVAIHGAFSTATDQIKGSLMGLYPSGYGIGQMGSAWLGALPPFLFILAVPGLWQRKRAWLAPVLLLLLFFILGDAFTLYSGAQQNRHLQVLAPFFFGFALCFLRQLRRDITPLYRFAVLFFFVFILLQSFGSLHFRKSNIERLALHKNVMDYLRQRQTEEPVLVQDVEPIYWADGGLNLQVLLVSANPYLGRHVKYHKRIVEISEYIQRFYPDRVLYLDYGKKTLVSEWLKTFQREELRQFMYSYRPFAVVKRLDLTGIRDRPPYGTPHAELDVGDTISEKTGNYEYVQAIEKPIGACLIKGDGFRDGGRPNVAVEEFDMPVPPSGGLLVCRYRGLFPGNVLEKTDASRVNLRIKATSLKVAANGERIFDQRISFDEGFSQIEIPLKKGGETHFKIEGLVHSFHYWVYSKY
ncbi:MAG: hypothetical protein JRJ85_18215, partial [Deltaproteobacteria bacterium]|nr:hypothetical protein [Deltaproteobacteria bacterium]